MIPQPKKEHRLDLRISDLDRERLQAVADSLNRSQSDTVRELIRQAYLDLPESLKKE